MDTSTRSKKRVLVGQPYYGAPKPRAVDSAKRCVDPQRTDLEVSYIPNCKSSLLAHGFNDIVVTFHTIGEFDYFAMLHADVVGSSGWLNVMVDAMEERELDVLHSVCNIKNDSGLTSTAIAYSDDEWSCVRRITLKELKKLPDVFDIDDTRPHFGDNAKFLLPNTGCMLIKAAEWFKDFPGFCVLDRIKRAGDAWVSEVVPEDWNFGFWCGKNGLKVGGTTRVLTRHIGEADYCNNGDYGSEVDWHWVQANVSPEEWARTQELNPSLVAS